MARVTKTNKKETYKSKRLSNFDRKELQECVNRNAGFLKFECKDCHRFGLCPGSQIGGDGLRIEDWTSQAILKRLNEDIEGLNLSLLYTEQELRAEMQTTEIYDGDKVIKFEFDKEKSLNYKHFLNLKDKIEQIERFKEDFLSKRKTNKVA